MLDTVAQTLRADARASLAATPSLASQLTGHRLAVLGGTGFVGSWLAEAVAALNDDLGCNMHIDLYGRTTADEWYETRGHLRRGDISPHSLDVRSPFELHRDTTLVLFAAGIADGRVQASEPHRVFQTSVYGMDNTLAAAARLERLHRVVNLSSGLALGSQLPQRALLEDDIGALEFARFHNVYAEARRAAESLASAYASQYRIPVSTARAFTFIGPYQRLDAPWALNNFIKDAVLGNEIRIHGDGGTRRSYLYGSDVATWLLKALVDGRDGEVYNLGGTEPFSHREAAGWAAAHATPTPNLVYKSQPKADGRNYDFYPNVANTMQKLGVTQVIDAKQGAFRTMEWHAHFQGVNRRVRGN